MCNPCTSLARPPGVTLLATFALSIIWYCFPYYGAYKWFEGPVSTLEKADGSSSESSMEAGGLAAKVVAMDQGVGVGGAKDGANGQAVAVGAIPVAVDGVEAKDAASAAVKV